MFNEKSIISKWVADMYDQKVTEVDDVEFLLKIIGDAPKKILEVCCGSGRILVPLAKAGHTVTGFDADELMLAKIPAKAAGIDNITWRKADAVYDDWGTGYDVVVLAANILNNIISDVDYEKAQEQLIKNAAAALAPGGYIYIDYSPGGHNVKYLEKESSNWDQEFVIWEGVDGDGNHGRMVLLAGEYDARTQNDSFIRRFELTLANGEKITQDIPSVKHCVTLGQIHDWLRNYGFSTLQEYRDYNGNPIDDNSYRVILYARKFR